MDSHMFDGMFNGFMSGLVFIGFMMAIFLMALVFLVIWMVHHLHISWT